MLNAAKLSAAQKNCIKTKKGIVRLLVTTLDNGNKSNTK